MERCILYYNFIVSTLTVRNLAPWVKHLVENLEHVSVCACQRGGGEYSVLMHEYRRVKQGLNKRREQTTTDYTILGGASRMSPYQVID